MLEIHPGRGERSCFQPAASQGLLLISLQIEGEENFRTRASGVRDVLVGFHPDDKCEGNSMRPLTYIKEEKKGKHNLADKNCIEGSKENIDLLSAFTRYRAGGTGLTITRKGFCFPLTKWPARPDAC